MTIISKENNKSRNEYIDILRAVAIILMIFGHCLQYGNGRDFVTSRAFFDNVVFSIIYSFHMPLFILISGYVLYFSIVKKYSFVKFILKKSVSLLLPIAGWQAVDYIIGICDGTYKKYTVLTYIYNWGMSLFAACWFLWGIFYCSVFVYLANKWFKDSIIVYLIGFVGTFVVPNIIVPNLEFYKFMYAFFVVGYLFAKKMNTSNFSYIIHKDNMLKYILCVALLGVYIALFAFWNIDSYIYTSGYSIKGNAFNQVVIDIYRITIGIVGSALVAYIVWVIYFKIKEHNSIIHKIVLQIGIYSLGIYLISGRMVGWILLPFMGGSKVNYGINIIQTAVILLLSYLLTLVISKIPFISYLLLGGR